MRMSTSLRLALVLGAGLCLSASGLSLQPADERAPAQGRQPSGPGMDVESAMKSMNRALRTLRKNIEQPANKDENLKLLNDMQRACAAAKSQPLPGDVLRHAKDDTDKAKFADSYRKNLVASMRLLLDIEDAVAEGKSDVAKAKTDELVKLRDAAHKELGMKEERKGPPQSELPR